MTSIQLGTLRLDLIQLTIPRLLLKFIYTGILSQQTSADPWCSNQQEEIDYCRTDLQEVLSMLLGSNPEERPPLEEVLERLRGKLIPDVFYSYLHGYWSLLPDVQKSGLHECIKMLQTDFDDILFMTGISDSGSNETIVPVVLKLLFGLLREASTGRQQLSLLKLISQLAESCAFQRSTYTYLAAGLLSLWNVLGPDAKVALLEILQDLMAGLPIQEGQYVLECLEANFKIEGCLRVLALGSSLLRKYSLQKAAPMAPSEALESKMEPLNAGLSPLIGYCRASESFGCQNAIQTLTPSTRFTDTRYLQGVAKGATN